MSSFERAVVGLSIFVAGIIVGLLANLSSDMRADRLRAELRCRESVSASKTASDSLSIFRESPWCFTLIMAEPRRATPPASEP